MNNNLANPNFRDGKCPNCGVYNTGIILLENSIVLVVYLIARFVKNISYITMKN